MINSFRIFAHDWYFTRSWSGLVRGLPSLVVGLVVLAIVGLGAAANESLLIREYELLGAEGINEKDYDLASISFRKLRKLDPDQPRYQFALGVLAEQQGELDEARRIIAPLARLGEAGFAGAHVWMALDLIRDDRNLTPERARVWELHLKSAIRDEPTHLQAHSILAEYYLGQNRHGDAAPHLAAIVDRKPDLRVQLIQVYIQTGQQERAREQAQLASHYYMNVILEEDRNVEARLRWAASELFLNRYQQALQILQEGMQRWPDDRFRTTMAGVLVKWSDDVSPEQRYELLQQALSLAPDSTIVLQKLAMLAAPDSPKHQEVRTQLEELLAEGKSLDVVHFTLGTIAVEEGHLEKAAFHLEQAYRQNPKMVAVVNNLAWVLANSDPPRYERALELANSAVQLSPANGHVLETRGVIHFHLENWKDAITDLEAALPKLESAELKAQVHNRLAKAYDAIGQPEIAERHRELSAASDGGG